PSQQPQVPAVEKDDGPSSHVHFADSPCNTCENPCAEHPQLPDYLAKKIDQDLPLEGTMKPYAQHILIRVGKGRSWADDLDSTPDSFVVRVAQAVSAKKLPFRTLITAFESNDDVEGLEETAEQAQVVFYPQSLAMDRLAVADIAAAIDWLAGTVNAPSSVQTPATASAIIASAPEALAASTGMRVWHHKTTLFVCTHKRRDKRCGVAGPMLVDEFTKAFGEMGLTSQDVGVYGVSHFGGHKFAGNVIVYHGEADGSVVGDWLGRVRTCHVRPILATTVQQGKIFRELWRGRMDAL
ncbi:Sucraseferredoxin-like protein, partial [Entophlyctis helioformis]